MRVIVVGGGIAGLSVARGLLGLGHAPVLLEQGLLPNPLPIGNTRTAPFSTMPLSRVHASTSAAV